jgi:hypothetical protein
MGVFALPQGSGVTRSFATPLTTTSYRQPIAPAAPALYFEPNRGQVDRSVSFIAHGAGFTALLSPSRIRISSGSAAALLAFAGADPAAQGAGLRRLTGRVNYLIGRDRRAWHTDIPTYEGVEFRAVYPGIDLVYHGRASLEYDWRVHAGARLDRIRLHVLGGTARLIASGALKFAAGGGDLMQSRPVAYQLIAGHRVQVMVRYAAVGPSTFALSAGSYDRSRPVVIDPVVSFATYLGGEGGDSGKSVAVDASGNAYITGLTVSPDFPTSHPLATYHSPAGGPSDAFITELSSRGNGLVFSTFLGGSGFDEGFGISVDTSGVYVAGATESPDFPIVSGFQTHLAGGTDGFVAELSPTGDSLQYSSYIGGPQDDFSYALALDPSGDAYITGDTVPPPHGGGPNAPPSLSHAFVARISPTGALLYKMSLAGSFAETGYGIAADASGDAYVVGLTQSEDFPSPNSPPPGLIGPVDAYVVKIDPAGDRILYSTHLGGNDVSVADAVAVDAGGNAYVTGQTAATNFPVVGGFQRTFGGFGSSLLPGDAFVVRLDAFGRIRYSTYLGGRLDDEGESIAVDRDHNAYVTGWTESANFPIRDAVQPRFIGATCGAVGHPTYPCSDAFVTEIMSNGHLAWSTFLGGSGADYGNGIGVTPSGSVYVAGTTASPNLATVRALQRRSVDRSPTPLDAFVVKLSPGGQRITDQQAARIAEPGARHLTVSP